MTENLDFVIKALDGKRQTARNGKPYWFGREIMDALAYKDWRDFRDVIEKAKVSCDMAGNFSNDHFVRLDEKVEIGSGAYRSRENYALSKYACYLIAMNGDSGKPEIATAQAYFLDQTFKQEMQDALTEDERHLLLRDRVKDANKKLGGAAKEAGVRSQMFGIFQDSGYKGLYGGLGYQTIKKKKGIDEKEDLLDCIGRAELAANEFRITQTEEKIRIDRIRGEQAAIDTHHAVGRKVRKAIEDIGGTKPRVASASAVHQEIGATTCERSQEIEGKVMMKTENKKRDAVPDTVPRDEFNRILGNLISADPVKRKDARTGEEKKQKKRPEAFPLRASSDEATSSSSR